VEPPEVWGAVVYPEPRVAAYLLSELGGELSVVEGVVEYRPPAHAAAEPLVTLLEPTGRGSVRLTPGLEGLFR
jgi:hypothetical protein